MKTVSIIIPCKNEEKYIEKCIVSLLENNYPKELVSIYVCDGLSTDNTVEIIKKISSKNPSVFLLNNTKQTTPFALNLGLKKSEADIKIILGAHAEVDTNFISENVKTFEIDNKIGCVGGIIKNVYENNTSKIIGLAMSSPFGVGNAHFRTGSKDGYVDTVAFGAYKKEVFEKAGYFDESLTRNQDDEFNYRIINSRFKIYLNKAIKSKYYVRGSYDKLFRQYYQYGYWKVFVGKKHKAITSIRQLIPLFFVLFLIIGGTLSFIHSYLLILFLGGLVIYLVTAFLTAFPLKSNPFKIVYCFIILHTSYGLGYLMGILDFLILNKTTVKKSTSLTR